MKLSGIYRDSGQSAAVGQMIGLPSPALLASVSPNIHLLVPQLRDIVDRSFSRQSYHPNTSPEQDPCVSGFPRRANPSTDWAGGTEQPCSEYDGLMDDMLMVLGLDVALQQINAVGDDSPIAFFFKRLSLLMSNTSGYSGVLCGCMAQFGSSKEELRGHRDGVEALVWGISKLRHYLDDHKFVVFKIYSYPRSI